MIQGLIHAFTNGWKRAFDYKGRMKRAEFWTFALLSIGLGIILMFGLMAVHDALRYVVVAYIFSFVVAYVSAIVRRVRDTGKPLWWLLVALVPYIGRYVVWVLLFMPSADEEQVAEAA